MTAANHQIFEPNAISLTGNSETGRANLFYRMLSGETIAIVLPPELLQQTISHLSMAVLQSPHPEVKALAQLFAVREISAHLHQAATVTLKYEIEAGATLETSIDREDALRLKDQLAAALDAQANVGSQSRH